MENIAPAVMNGGFSSILALSLLATSQSHIFTSFFSICVQPDVVGLAVSAAAPVKKRVVALGAWRTLDFLLARPGLPRADRPLMAPGETPDAAFLFLHEASLLCRVHG